MIVIKQGFRILSELFTIQQYRPVTCSLTFQHWLSYPANVNAWKNMKDSCVLVHTIIIPSSPTDNPGANSECPYQTALKGAIWSGSALFAILSAPFGRITVPKNLHCSYFRIITTTFGYPNIWAASRQNHPPSLIRVFTVRMKKAWVLSYPLSAQRRLWSDWADGFVVKQLKYLDTQKLL